MLHDEQAYPEPHTFNPDRYLKDGKINPDVQDPTTACFGFGRRKCAGRFIAVEAMWIVIASTLASLTISKAKGPDGHPITPPEEYAEKFLWYASQMHAWITTHLLCVHIVIRNRLTAIFSRVQRSIRL